MQLKKRLLLVFLLPFIIACNSKRKEHIISDPDLRDSIHSQFLERKEFARGRDRILFGCFDQNLTVAEKEGLEFLYTYMPLSDLAMHSGEYVLQQVRSSLEAREFLSWGGIVPEDIFRHFVLPYRINNEYTDTARQVFFNDLKNRISKLSMYDAALEVNHWCHEKVIYKGSDERTSGPLTTVRNAQGRCGEESTFVVTALRSVCIPARQVYTPRWAHTDDNHAWVEVWIDGKWYYMGACEPDPELNMGWFTEPAKRAMMMHTVVFGKYDGSEEVLQKDALYTRINLLANYAPVRTLNVKVQYENGSPVSNAKVEFMLYNYAEFYPISTKYSDNKGNCSTITGFGDLIVWASHKQSHGYTKSSGKSTDTILVTIKKPSQVNLTENYELIPPVQVSVPPADPVKVAANNKRLLYEDSIRNAFVSTFIDSSAITELADRKSIKPSEIYYFLKESRGNWKEISSFIENLKKEEVENGLALLRYISEKDLHDILAVTLNDHLQTLPLQGNLKKEIYQQYVLSPRIGREFVTQWRSYIQQYFSKDQADKFRDNPDLLVSWIKENISLDTLNNYYNVPLSPEGIIELKVADKYSRNLLFVSICRSFGIPSRLEPATRIPQYLNKDKWVDIRFEAGEVKVSPKGVIVLKNLTDDKNFIPQYYTHFTIAKLERGQFITLDYEFDPTLKSFPCSVSVDTGYYRLMTGNRMNDGSVLCRINYFPVKEDQRIDIPVVLTKVEIQTGTLGKAEEGAGFKIFQNDTGKVLKDFFNKKGLVVAVIDPEKEPTKHLIEDIKLVKSNFENWNGNLLLIVGKEKLTSAFKPSNYNSLPSNTIIGYDESGEITNAIDLMCGENPGASLPQISIINDKGEISFYTEGYSIGLGETILKNLNSLQK